MRRFAGLAGGLLLLAPVAAWAQGVGAPPDPTFAYRDLDQAFALPPLKDAGPLGREAAKLQVMVRARRLGLTGRSALDAWRQAGPRYAAARRSVEAARAGGAADTVFTGDRVSALNALISGGAARIRVASLRLTVDQPLRIARSGVRLDLGRADLHGDGAGGPYIVRIEGADHVVLLGGVFTGRDSGVLVSAARDVIVADGRFTGLSGDGVLVTNARDTVVWGNRLTGLGRAPILLHGETTGAVVADNDIRGNLGASNWHAGVVLTDRNADLAADPQAFFAPGLYGARPQPIPERLRVPRLNLIVGNTIAQNRASGIYSDGSVENVFASNLIEGNAKEGLCLDNGSTADVAVLNAVSRNGARWGVSDAELQRDFIARFGRLPDGTAVAKVPGVSIDNAAYNLVYANAVFGNYGGGIKMVRTAWFNTVGLNTVAFDNEGRSERFHFFGVELGAASADEPVPDLDFTPSRGDIVFSNLIRGDHYAGVFFAAGSDRNDVFDNSVFGATDWAFESAVRQDNATLNNLTNQPSRNIGPGLDPRLTALTAERDD